MPAFELCSTIVVCLSLVFSVFHWHIINSIFIILLSANHRAETRREDFSPGKKTFIQLKFCIVSLTRKNALCTNRVSFHDRTQSGSTNEIHSTSAVKNI